MPDEYIQWEFFVRHGNNAYDFMRHKVDKAVTIHDKLEFLRYVGNGITIYDPKFEQELLNLILKSGPKDKIDGAVQMLIHQEHDSHQSILY